MKPETNSEAAETVQTRNVQAVDLPRLVRLSDAMIAWNPMWGPCSRGGEPGQVGVCKHPDNGQLKHLSMWVKPSGHRGTYDKRTSQLQLMVEAWHLACRDGVPLANIHAALSAIPEYRDMLSEDFEILPNPQDHPPQVG